MSSRTSRILLAGLFSAAVACCLTVPARSQAGDDLLDEAKKRQQVELQRVEADFKQTYDAAKILSKTEPAKAIAMLEVLQEALAANADIPAANRDAMLKQLKNAIVAYKARAIDLASTTQIPAPPRTEAPKKTDDDGRKAVDEVKDKQARMKKALAQDNYQKKAREEGWVELQVSNDKVLMPQAEDIKFPADWQERTKNRSKINMTAEEKKLVEALNKPMDIELADSTLEDVLKYLHDKTGVTINVSPLALEDKGITYKVPVAVNLKGVTLRTVLKKTLADVGLTYIVDKGTIQVTTEERAANTLTTRTYYIGDLVGVTGQRYGPYANRAQTVTALNDIIGVVVGTVEPNSWWVNGGKGTIAFDPRTMTLVVSQTAEIHYMLGGLGAGGR